MFSELILVIGFVFLAGALGMLWNIHMSTHAQPANGTELDDAEGNHSLREAVPGRFRSMPGLAPAIASHASHGAAAIPEPQESADVDANPEMAITASDHPDVQLHLTLAEQLNIVGDHEGATTYAEMVVSDDRASPRQTALAQALLRRDSNA
ncbi:hypothetical protein QX25_17965 (plasmid) [Stutzerimonas stutzeri]|nr:hypothetical protein QX25_17965 [Stutzerimonas stutzeri]